MLVQKQVSSTSTMFNVFFLKNLLAKMLEQAKYRSTNKNNASTDTKIKTRNAQI